MDGFWVIFSFSSINFSDFSKFLQSHCLLLQLEHIKLQQKTKGTKVSRSRRVTDHPHFPARPEILCSPPAPAVLGVDEGGVLSTAPPCPWPQSLPPGITWDSPGGSSRPSPLSGSIYRCHLRY